MEVREFPIPDTGDDDGLLRIEACGLCGTDYEQWLGEYERGYPMIPGHELVGTVERLGSAAAARWGVRRGDRVVVDASVPCGTCTECRAGSYKRCASKLGYGMHVKSTVPPYLWGGYATHAYLHPRAMLSLAPRDIPTNVMTLANPLSNAIAWTIEVGGVGLGDTVVICGPGQRGLLAVVAAREAGAATIIITGTKHDAYRLQLALDLGATAAIDVDAADPVELVREITRGALADVVVDVSAFATAPLLQALDMARPGGTIVVAGVKGASHPVNGLNSDKIMHKELRLIGVRSSGPTATAKAIRLITRHADELATLCTHEYGLNDAATAIRVLGREVTDGGEAVHVHLNGTL